MNSTTSILRSRGGNWIAGNVGRFAVSAKIFGENSHYGMAENGRISKLWVKDDRGHVVFNYDRGLDVCEIDDAELAAIITAVTA